MSRSSQKNSTEIRKLLQSLNEDNYDSVVHELSQYIEYGTEESILLVESCLHHFKIYEKKDLKTMHLEPAIASLFRKLMEKPHFCEVFSGLVQHLFINEVFLKDLSTALQLSPFEKLGFGLALSDSKNNDVRMAGRNFCMVQLEELCQLAERGHEASVRSLLKLIKYPLQHFPETLLLRMAHVITPQNLIQHEVSSTVLPVLLEDASMSGVVIQLWHANPLLFSRALNAILNLNPQYMNKIVDLFQEFEIIVPALDLVPISLAIRLAVVASQKEYIDLEEWLTSNLKTYEDIFFEECQRFLKEVECDIQEPFDQAHNTENWDLCKEAAPTFFKVLQVHTSLLSSHQLSEKMKSLCITSTHNSPMIENVGDPDSSVSEVYADHIDTEANAYFQQMLSGQLTVDAIVQMLTKFKGSSEKREQLVYEYMIKSLLEVNKFFNGYPDEQQKLAAALFGLLIRHQVVNDSTLGIALQTVMDALHKPADSKLFIFGTNALENFVDRLIEWPEYRQQVLKISHLRGTHSELVSIIEQTVDSTSSGHPESHAAHNPGNSIPPANAKPQSVVRSSRLMASAPDFHPPSRGLTPASRFPVLVEKTSSGSFTGFGSTSIGTLLTAAERRKKPIQAPSSKIQDRVSFIVNNLSAANIEAKAKEFTEILEEQYYPWFAQYVVIKRASTEPNFHMLYMNFFEKANSKRLMEELVIETYENCKVLLRSELIQSSAEERTLLNNLGGWLGKITIGRNKVLLSKHINPKSLIIEAYEKGLMIGIIPFTSKVLEPCKGSLAYQPPNPWTMAILGLLTEIHAMPNLTGNLKFAIEVLFKKIDVDMMSVTPTSLLKDRVRKIEGNPDFSNKNVGSSQQPVVENTPGSAVHQGELPHEAAGPSYQGGDSHILYQHDAPLHVPAIAVGEDMNMLFQRVLPMVMATTINEIVSTIVQRSVSIATQTTMELVFKEYVNNSDENYIHSASCSIVVCLAANLSYVTSKEPLRRKMSSQLRNSLQGLNIASEFIERVIDENLELGCALIEKAATEMGLTLVQKELAHQLSVRRKHRECSGPALTTGAALDEYQILSKKLELLIAKDAKEAEIQSVIAEVSMIVLRCISKDEAALAVAQMEFECLYENAAITAHVNAHLAILAAICDVSKLVWKELTSWVLHADDEIKFNKDITIGLIRKELLNLIEYDAHMAKHIDRGKSGTATEFLISLVQTLEANDARVLSAFHNVLDELAKTEQVTKNHVASWDDDDASISSESDPASFSWQVSFLFTDWCRICSRPGVNDAARAHYVLQLIQNLFSIADDIPDRFFHHLMELAVSHFLSSEGTSQEAYLSPFIVIDIYTDLVFSILKFCPVDKGSDKLSLFSKALAAIVRFTKKDAEEKKESFNPKPYFRLFINFFDHLGTVDSDNDDAYFQILAALSKSFHALQPVNVPAFSFTWVELISHKDFMPKLFAANGQKGWPYFKHLLVDLLQFMELFLRTGELTEPVRALYKGTLRVVLVLVHEFPEFICYYHLSFCEVIASRCVQLRNIILSTFPSNMRLPDPKSPNLKVDLLPEMSLTPCIDPEFDAALKANKMKRKVDEYLKTRPENSSFLLELKHKLLLSSSEAERSGTCYNVPLVNSLVLYVGTKISYFAGAALDIFRTLILDLDSEGRYLFFNAVTDQLRYPSNHTHFFSFVMLLFFREMKEESIQEQITRVLLERLITKLPHPWGVQVTFIELVKNPGYNFWNLNFTRCDPEIKRVFDSVSATTGITVQDVPVPGVL